MSDRGKPIWQRRHPRVIALFVAAMTAVAVGALVPPDPVLADEPVAPVVRQLLALAPDSSPTVSGEAVSFSDDGESIGYAQAPMVGPSPSRTAPVEGEPPDDFGWYQGGGYWVVDEGEGDTEPAVRYLASPNILSTHNYESQISGDGLTFVATFRAVPGSVIHECGGEDDPNAGALYWNQQVLVWQRESRDDEFDLPDLVTADPSRTTECTSLPEFYSQIPLLGVGGDDGSWSPSVSDDGSSVVFVSRASNLGVGPTDAGLSGLFVRESGVVEMVTPAGIDGDVHDAMISGDGTTIVFTSEATNLVSGETIPAGSRLVYLATRDGSSWDIELISRNSDGSPASDGEDPAEAYAVTIDDTASRAAWYIDAEDLDPALHEPEGAGEGWEPGWYLVAHDIEEEESKVVVNRQPDLTAHFLGEGLDLGDPYLSADGERLAISIHSGQVLVFDMDAALSSGDRRDARLTRRRLLGGYGPRHVAIEGAGDDYTVAFGSVARPQRGFVGHEGGALYFLGGQGIGPDISRGWHADPVDVALGAFRHDETDLEPSAAPGSVGLSRTYSSTGALGGVFGPGWMTAIDERIDVLFEDETVTLTEATGVETTFVATSPGVWASTSPRSLTLNKFVDELEESEYYAVTDPSGRKRLFGANGALSRVITPGQPTIYIDWETAPDRLAVIESSTGDAIALYDTTGYDEFGVPVAGEDGLVDVATSSDGREVTYGYVLDGPDVVLGTASRPHVVGQASGTYGTRTYEVDHGRITRITDAVDATRVRTIVENAYDRWGRVIEQVSATGDVTEFTYDQVPDDLGGLTTAPGFTTATDTHSGDQTIYEYNDRGEAIAVTDAAAEQIGRSFWGDRALTVTSRSGVTTTYTYDDARRVVEVTETAGSETRVVAEYTYWTPDTDPTAATDDRIETSTDAAGVTTTYSYTGASRQPDTVSVPCDAASADPARPCDGSGLATTSYVYDDELVTEVTDPDGVTTTFTHHGDRTVASSTTDEGGLDLTTTYDTFRPADDGWGDLGAPVATAEARRTITPTGATTFGFYDSEGRIVESRDPLYDGTTHQATIYEYWLDGGLKQVTDPSGNVTTYDVARAGDAEWSETDPDIAEVTTVTDPDGVATITKTDRSGDVVEEIVGDPGDPSSRAVTTSTYGPLGRLESTIGPDGVTTTFRYDVEGRVVETTVGPDGEDPEHTTSTVYDDWGNVVETSTPAGLDPDDDPVVMGTQHRVDAAGRTIAQIDGVGGPTADQLMTGFVYDDAGRLWRTIEHLDGDLDVDDAQVIEDGDRVTETRYTPGGRTAQVLTAPENAVSFDWSGADATKSVTTFGYDDAGRQVVVTGPDGLDALSSFDDDGRVEETITPGGLVTGYSYDAAGNLTTVTTPSGLDGPGDPATVQVDRSYTPTGQLGDRDRQLRAGHRHPSDAQLHVHPRGPDGVGDRCQRGDGDLRPRRPWQPDRAPQHRRGRRPDRGDLGLRPRGSGRGAPSSPRRGRPPGSGDGVCLRRRVRLAGHRDRPHRPGQRLRALRQRPAPGGDPHRSGSGRAGDRAVVGCSWSPGPPRRRRRRHGHDHGVGLCP